MAHLTDRECLLRDGKRIERLLKAARIKAAACLKDVDCRAGRPDRRARHRPVDSPQPELPHHRRHRQWQDQLACTLANAACRQGLSAYYVRLPRLFEELRIVHADGSFSRPLMWLARLDLVVTTTAGWPFRFKSEVACSTIASTSVAVTAAV